MNHYGSILGLISSSGRPEVKREQEQVMDAYASHYAGDWWFDAIQFLWRWELAGYPRDAMRWQTLQAFSRTILPQPRPMNAFADFHVPLADAMVGNGEALAAWLEQMEELTRARRYPGGTIVPEVARGLAAFAHGDHASAIAKLVPLLAKAARLGGGSRAQHDLVEFTLLRAYVRRAGWTRCDSC